MNIHRAISPIHLHWTQFASVGINNRLHYYGFSLNFRVVGKIAQRHRKEAITPKGEPDKAPSNFFFAHFLAFHHFPHILKCHNYSFDDNISESLQAGIKGVPVLPAHSLSLPPWLYSPLSLDTHPMVTPHESSMVFSQQAGKTGPGLKQLIQAFLSALSCSVTVEN